jgi:DNA-binding MarR family transcriptional regulator
MSDTGGASTPSDRLLDALVQTSFEVIGVVSRIAAENDLSLTQLRMLAILRDREPAMSDLAVHLGVDRSSVSGLVDRAAQRGLVTRVRVAEDRRSSRVALTLAGHRLAATGTSAIFAGIEPLLGSLAPDERAQLTRLLESVLRRE